MRQFIFQQYLETLFIGFVLLYAYDYIMNYIRFRNGALAILIFVPKKKRINMMKPQIIWRLDHVGDGSYGNK